MKPSSLALLLPVLALQLSAETLSGNFIFGTGHWNTLPNGGFETGSLSDWAGFSANPATFGVTDSSPIVGTYSSLITADVSFTGNGLSLTTLAQVPVQGGQSYVLSGFIVRSSASTANMSFDLNDVPFEVQPHSTVGLNDTQFVWGIFTPPADTSVSVRFVLDQNTTLGDAARLDEVAITPLDQFVPPTIAVPELPATALIAGAILTGFALWRRR